MTDNNSAQQHRARRREAALRRLGKTGPSTTGAIVIGIGVIVAAGAVTAAGSIWGNTPEMDTAAEAAQLPATNTQEVCAAPPRLPEGSDEDQDLEFSAASSDEVSAVSVAAASDLAGNIPGMSYYPAETDPDEDPEATNVTDPLDEETQQGPPATAAADGTVTNRAHFELLDEPGGDAANPVALSIEPVGGTPGTASGTAQYAATDGDLAGLIVAACTPAAHQHWLPGAATTTGTTAVLTVTNPSATNSTVDVTVHDQHGPTEEASGATDVVLAPGQTRSMLVAGLAPSRASVAVHVASSGGPVAADIQQHRLDGIVPAGVDTLQPAATGTNVVIPGIDIPDDAEDIADGSGLDNQHPTLHIASTGSAANATIGLRGPDGPVDLPTEASAVEIAPGATETVNLADVEPGTYAVEIDADANIVASAASLSYNTVADDDSATGNTSAVDTAYMPTTESIRGETMVALPAIAEPEAELLLTSEAEASVSITPIDTDGEPGDAFTQELAEDTAVTVDADAAAYLLETGSNSVHAGLLVDSEAGVSAMPINTVTETGSGLPVRLGY